MYKSDKAHLNTHRVWTINDAPPLGTLVVSVMQVLLIRNNKGIA